MKVGIGFPAKSYEQVEKYVKAAIDYPLESFVCYGDLGDMPPYMALSVHIQALTDSPIRYIGPLGSPVGRMDTELLASHAKAFEGILGGRSLVGLVRGAFLDEIGGQAAPLSAVEDAIAEIRTQAPLSKLAIGGFGKRIVAMATRNEVDYIKLGGSASTKLASYIMSQIKDSSPDKAPRIILGSVSVIDNDVKAARLQARQSVAKYLKVVGHLDPTLDADQIDSLDRFTKTDSVLEISDSLLDAFSYCGTADDVYERLQEAHTVGVDHVQLGTPHDIPSHKSSVRVIGEMALT